MAGRLDNKVAIVTGATSGIGRAVTVLFMKEGAKVVFAGLREENGLEIEQELRDVGGDVMFVKTDVTKKEDLQYLVNTTIEKYGRIDVLVNNAGDLPAYAAKEFGDVKDYEDSLSVHAKSCLMLCREVLPYMVRQQKGSIINTSSADVEAAATGVAPYAAGKGAIKAFTRSLAGEYADQGIRVNAVMPGLTMTGTVPENTEFEQRAAETVPMGRAGRPEEIAYGFLFFASDESSFCTGSSLIIDGGAMAM